MPKVSVIIPNNNHARFLDRRLRSVLDQTWCDFEILLLNDAASEDSLQVLEPYQYNPLVRTLFNDINADTPGNSWNQTIRAARGEFIWLADPTDFADPRFLKTLVPLLETNPRVGLAYCSSLLIDEQGHRIPTADAATGELELTRWQSDYIGSGVDECRHHLVHRNTIPNSSAVLFRKSLYESVVAADESLEFAGSWTLWVTLLLVSDVAYVAAPLNYSRGVHSRARASMPQKERLLLEEHLSIINMIQDRVGLPPGVQEELCRRCAIEWTEHVARSIDGNDSRLCSARLVQQAHAAGPEIFFALVSASLEQTLRSAHALRDVKRATETVSSDLAACFTKRFELLEARINERSDSSPRLWNRVCGLMLPHGSLRRRILRKVYRTVMQRRNVAPQEAAVAAGHGRIQPKLARTVCATAEPDADSLMDVTYSAQIEAAEQLLISRR